MNSRFTKASRKSGLPRAVEASTSRTTVEYPTPQQTVAQWKCADTSSSPTQSRLQAARRGREFYSRSVFFSLLSSPLRWNSNQQPVGTDELEALVEGPFQPDEIGIHISAKFRQGANGTWSPTKHALDVIPGPGLFLRLRVAPIRAEWFAKVGHGCVDCKSFLTKVKRCVDGSKVAVRHPCLP